MNVNTNTEQETEQLLAARPWVQRRDNHLDLSRELNDAFGHICYADGIEGRPDAGVLHFHTLEGLKQAQSYLESQGWRCCTRERFKTIVARRAIAT